MKVRKYIKSSGIVLLALRKAKGRGLLATDLVALTGYTLGTVQHSLQWLAKSERSKSMSAGDSVGDRCTNRLRYFAAEAAPPGARFSHKAGAPDGVQSGHFMSVCAPSEAAPLGFPPGWWADRTRGLAVAR